MPYKDKERGRLYQLEYSRNNKERKKPACRKSWLMRNYGLTVEEYDQMLLDQNHCCALCDRHVSSLERQLAVDHCHATGRIRGLLCMPCNTSLGQLGDDEESMHKIINYLNQNSGV